MWQSDNNYSKFLHFGDLLSIQLLRWWLWILNIPWLQSGTFTLSSGTYASTPYFSTIFSLAAIFDACAVCLVFMWHLQYEAKVHRKSNWAEVKREWVTGGGMWGLSSCDAKTVSSNYNPLMDFSCGSSVKKFLHKYSIQKGGEIKALE